MAHPVATSDAHGHQVQVSGRRAGQARSHVHRRRRTAHRSFVGTWTLGDRAFAETRIEAGSDEWLGKSASRRFLCGHDLLDSARVAGFRTDGRRELYRDVVSRSKLFKDLIRGEMIGPVCVRDATPRFCKDPIGTDFIRVGEACVAIDPLSSQGIQTALLSAIQASAAVHTILTAGCDPAAARTFYRERQQAVAARSRLSAARCIGSTRYRMHFGCGERWRRTARPATSNRSRRQPPRRHLDCGWIGPANRRCTGAVGRVDPRAPAHCPPPAEHRSPTSGVAVCGREADDASTVDQILRRGRMDAAGMHGTS